MLSIIGATSEAIPAALISAALAGLADEVLVHTGRHDDAAPGSRPRDEQLKLGEEHLLDVIAIEQPDVVLVRGATTTTLSGARAAAAAHVPLIHIDAGLRSSRDDSPEERNRVETDGLSDVLCAPCPGARDVLVRERVRGAIHVTGDPLCDALQLARRHVEPDPGDYLLATVHRSCNTDDSRRLRSVLDCLGRSPWPVVMPIHPRTRVALERWGIVPPPSIRTIDPVAHPRMLALERGARVIATDSGGVQREAYLWGVPCVTLREETEWTDTVLNGWNTLVGADPERFAAALRRPRPLSRPAIFGDGRAAHRIAELTAALATAVRSVLA